LNKRQTIHFISSAEIRVSLMKNLH